jgi:23S rRNA pseudouridine2605 synthase
MLERTLFAQQEGNTVSTPQIPSAQQLAENRSKAWHHDARPLLTVESLRAWLAKVGLVLYTPRPRQLPVPAPSFVEATLGTLNASPTPAEAAEARSLLTRLIAEGSAVPLNLMGTTGDTPDFVVSAAVFPYLFTLRGDKAWKQPPATIGAVKVSPLALAAHQALAARVTLSIPELVNELGKEVTETAVLRALSELWSHLRVVPVPQADGDTQWELMSTRFTKQIKAGANAGQPKALSALITLYLGTAILATEEEIETYLSPLAPRSRIRDVVHALMGARELETIAVDGRTVLYIPGELPVFESATPTAAEEPVEVDAIAASTEPTLEGTDRIKKFVAKPRKLGTGFAKKFTPRTPDDRERRPFQKKPFTPSKPSFSKPWEEEKAARPAAAETAENGATAAPGFDRPKFDRPKRTFGDRPSFGSKPAYGSKPAFGSKPSYGSKPGFSRNDGGTRPTFRRDSDDSRPPRHDFTPRPPREGSHDGSFQADGRPPRKTFSKPGTFGRKREGGFQSDARPPRREFTPRDSSGEAPRRPFSRERPAFGAKPTGERRPGSYSPRPTGDRKPFTPGKPFAKPGGFSRDRDQRSGEAPRKTYRKFDAPRESKPRTDKPGSDRPRPFNPDGPASSGYAGKKPFAKPGGFKSEGGYKSSGPKSFGAKPGGYKSNSSSRPRPTGTFAKFADGAKPFRKPGPGGKKFGGKPSGNAYGGPKRGPRSGDSA